MADATRIFMIGLVVVITLAIVQFCQVMPNAESYRLSPTKSVLFGEPPTSNSIPTWAYKTEVALPNMRTPAPSLPIISTQPNPVNLHSWLIKYIGADDLLHTDCIREHQADLIPRDRILPSSLVGGKYSLECQAETSMPYKMWPF